MIRVHVGGASGYAAAEAVRLLSMHPAVELGVLESHSHAGEALAKHFPLLRHLTRSFDEVGKLKASVLPGDCVILGGAHGTAQRIVPDLLARGARIIDLSADFRFDPDLAVYGFPQRYREAIRGANVIANPGCYPTATLLATLPLASCGSVDHIVVDAKSGVTGAGRTPSQGTHFAEVHGDVRAYGLNGHRHEPEILQQWQAGDLHAGLTFTPHVVPIARGMLVNAYALCSGRVDAASILAAFAQAYAGDPFVRVVDGNGPPSVPAVVGTNNAELHVSVRGPVVRVLCAIDNLGKGAAGQAVHNLNIMYDLPEEAGLRAHAVAS